MTWNLGPSAWKAMRQSFLQILWPTGSLGTLKAVPKNRQFSFVFFALFVNLPYIQERLYDCIPLIMKGLM